MTKMLFLASFPSGVKDLTVEFFSTGLAFRARFAICITREEMAKMFLRTLFPSVKDVTPEIPR